MHPQSLFDPAGLANLQSAGSGTHAVLAAHLRRWLDNHQRAVGGENVAGYAVMARVCGDRSGDINWAKSSLLAHVDKPWPMTRWPQQDPPGYSDLVQASAILNGAIGYDVLHKFLSPDERTRCQDKLRQLTGNFANAADGGIWWVRDLVQNHNWVNFAAIGIAGQTSTVWARVAAAPARGAGPTPPWSHARLAFPSSARSRLQDPTAVSGSAGGTLESLPPDTARAGRP